MMSNSNLMRGIYPASTGDEAPPVNPLPHVGQTRNSGCLGVREFGAALG